MKDHLGFFSLQANHLNKSFITKTDANGTEGGFQPYEIYMDDLFLFLPRTQH